MSSTIGFQKMGRKLDMEKDDGFTLHLLERDSQVGNVTSHNVIDAIDHSKRVILVISTYVWGYFEFYHKKFHQLTYKSYKLKVLLNVFLLSLCLLIVLVPVSKCIKCAFFFEEIL